MKATLSVIALVAALAVPSAMAQDLDLDLDAGAGAAGSVDTGAGGVSAGADVDATVTGSISAGDIDSVDDLSAAMEASLATDLDFAAMTDVEILIVEVSSLEASAEGSAALDAMIEANADSLASLQASLAANAAINAELEAAGFDSTDVVAVVGSEAEGSITLYVDESA